MPNGDLGALPDRAAGTNRRRHDPTGAAPEPSPRDTPGVGSVVWVCRASPSSMWRRRGCRRPATGSCRSAWSPSSPTARSSTSGRRSSACAGRGAGSGPRHVHGITRRSLRGAPRRRRRSTSSRDRLAGAVFTAHNAEFDAAFLERPPPGADVPLVARPAPVHAAAVPPPRPRPPADPRPGRLCARYDVPLDRHHDALGDAQATAAVLPHLLAAHDVRDEADLDAALLAAARRRRSGPAHAPPRRPPSRRHSAGSRTSASGPRRTSNRSSHRSLATGNVASTDPPRRSFTTSTG